MASWQAHLAVWMVRWRVKRRLRGAPDYRMARKILRPDPYRVPANVRVSPAKVGGVPGEWVGSAADTLTAAAPNLLLYLHGGGYFGCSAETHRPITAFYARNGFRVFAPDYRLAPENKFPAALEDAVAVYRALLAEGACAQRIFVSGDSAGGGLAICLMLALRETSAPLPAAAAVFSPWTDLAATGDSIRTNAKRCAMFHGADIAPSARYYLGDVDPKTPLASPLYADLRGLPPILIHVGQDEVLRDDSTRLAERARAAGVRVELKVWPVVPHAWQLALRQVPEAAQSLREATAFFQSFIAQSQEAPRKRAQQA
jgi:acetyl esterase/lipase